MPSASCPCSTATSPAAVRRAKCSGRRDVSGNGVSHLVITIMSAVAEFERKRISERVRDSKAQRRHENRHMGGHRPLGWRLGEPNGHGRARELVSDPVEQAAIAEIVALRRTGQTLMAVRNHMRAKGFPISHQLVADLERRHAADNLVENAFVFSEEATPVVSGDE
jgi:putative DNA-invertase from lambdoid prophage Rac